LLKYGLRLTEPVNDVEETALHFVCHRLRISLSLEATELGKKLIVWLLDHGLDINARDACSRTPLAVLGGENTALIELLESKGARKC
jgi:hypothetical protein